jgi:hypothetical protein
VPGDQLAERRHWEAFYRRALADDHAHRRTIKVREVGAR